MSNNAEVRYQTALSRNPDRAPIDIIKSLRGLRPVDRGELAGHHVRSLVGLPYGPGRRQQDYIRGYQATRGMVVQTRSLEGAPEGKITVSP